MVSCRSDVIRFYFEIVEIKIVTVFLEKILAYVFKYCTIAGVFFVRTVGKGLVFAGIVEQLVVFGQVFENVESQVCDADVFGSGVAVGVE